jgi:hypothetical protein
MVDVGVSGESGRETATEVLGDPGDQYDTTHRPTHDVGRLTPAGKLLALTTALDARLLQQLAMLLLGHALTALLDDGTHGLPLGRHCATIATSDANLAQRTGGASRRRDRSTPRADLFRHGDAPCRNGIGVTAPTERKPAPRRDEARCTTMRTGLGLAA